MYRCRLGPEVRPREKKRKDYAFRRQVNEKPIIVPGCALRCVLLYLAGLLSGQLLFASDPGQPF